jgi:hypothetical protein
MKNMIKVFGIIFMVMIIGLLMMGCEIVPDDDNDETENNPPDQFSITIANIPLKYQGQDVFMKVLSSTSDGSEVAYGDGIVKNGSVTCDLFVYDNTRAPFAETGWYYISLALGSDTYYYTNGNVADTMNDVEKFNLTEDTVIACDDFQLKPPEQTGLSVTIEGFSAEQTGSYATVYLYSSVDDFGQSMTVAEGSGTVNNNGSVTLTLNKNLNIFTDTGSYYVGLSLNSTKYAYTDGYTFTSDYYLSEVEFSQETTITWSGFARDFISPYSLSLAIFGIPSGIKNIKLYLYETEDDILTNNYRASGRETIVINGTHITTFQSANAYLFIGNRYYIKLVNTDNNLVYYYTFNQNEKQTYTLNTTNRTTSWEYFSLF